MNKCFEIKSDFKKYINIFLEENSKHNLVSKNDEQFLYEKHIYDSLSIKLFIEKYNINPCEILDIGCGGGFPCVPIAIEYPEFSLTGIDSIRKKTDSVNKIINKLGLKNIKLLCDRAENLRNRKFDIITSRAVGELSKILSYGLPLLKRNGYFIAYKSKKAEEEILNSDKILKVYNSKVIDIIEYTLPLKEIFERKLICIKKF